jgi:hypothetical protein
LFLRGKVLRLLTVWRLVDRQLRHLGRSELCCRLQCQSGARRNAIKGCGTASLIDECLDIFDLALHCVWLYIGAFAATAPVIENDGELLRQLARQWIVAKHLSVRQSTTDDDDRGTRTGLFKSDLSTVFGCYSLCHILPALLRRAAFGRRRPSLSSGLHVSAVFHLTGREDDS